MEQVESSRLGCWLTAVTGETRGTSGLAMEILGGKMYVFTLSVFAHPISCEAGRRGDLAMFLHSWGVVKARVGP